MSDKYSVCWFGNMHSLHEVNGKQRWKIKHGMYIGNTIWMFSLYVPTKNCNGIARYDCIVKRHPTVAFNHHVSKLCDTIITRKQDLIKSIYLTTLFTFQSGFIYILEWSISYFLYSLQKSSLYFEGIMFSNPAQKRNLRHHQSLTFFLCSS